MAMTSEVRCDTLYAETASRLAALIIAALVGSDHAKACTRERAYLLVPAIPELRKAVQQDHHRAVLRTRSHGVQSNVTMVEPLFFKSRLTAHPLKLVELSYLRRRWGPARRGLSQNDVACTGVALVPSRATFAHEVFAPNLRRSGGACEPGDDGPDLR